MSREKVKNYEPEYLDPFIHESTIPGMGINEVLPGSSVSGWNKLVGDINAAYTQIAQTDASIVLLAGDVAGNSSSITVQAGQIASIVSDVAGNSSSITVQAGQIASIVSDVAGNTASISVQADQIASIVSDVAGNSSSITQAVDSIALKVSDSAAVKASVVVNAVNGGTVNINGNRINITGNATFNATKNDATTALSTANSALSEANSKNKTFRQSSTPSGAVEGDIWIETDAGDRVRRYNGNSWITTNTEINGGLITTGTVDTDRLNVTEIFAQDVTATGTITGARLRTSSSSNRIEIRNNNTISFYIDGSVSATLVPRDVSGFEGIGCLGDMAVIGDMLIEDNLAVFGGSILLYQSSGTNPKALQNIGGDLYWNGVQIS